MARIRAAALWVALILVAAQPTLGATFFYHATTHKLPQSPTACWVNDPRSNWSSTRFAEERARIEGILAEWEAASNLDIRWQGDCSGYETEDIRIFLTNLASDCSSLTRELCEETRYCEWMHGSCRMVTFASAASCASLREENCVGPCAFNVDLSSCETVCAGADDSSACRSIIPDRETFCTFNFETEVCAPRPQVEANYRFDRIPECKYPLPKCGLGTPTTCETDAHCQWVGGRCYPQTRIYDTPRDSWGALPVQNAPGGDLDGCRFNVHLAASRERNTYLHEFGHTMGLRHEQSRGDGPPECVDSLSEPGSNAPIGDYDETSVMHYSRGGCNRGFGSGAATGLSAQDKLAVALLYPRDDQPGIVGDHELAGVLPGRKTTLTLDWVRDGVWVEGVDDVRRPFDKNSKPVGLSFPLWFHNHGRATAIVDGPASLGIVSQGRVPFFVRVDVKHTLAPARTLRATKTYVFDRSLHTAILMSVL